MENALWFGAGGIVGGLGVCRASEIRQDAEAEPRPGNRPRTNGSRYIGTSSMGAGGLCKFILRDARNPARRQLVPAGGRVLHMAYTRRGHAMQNFEERPMKSQKSRLIVPNRGEIRDKLKLELQHPGSEPGGNTRASRPRSGYRG
jgi:hypothetical protein